LKYPFLLVCFSAQFLTMFFDPGVFIDPLGVTDRCSGTKIGAAGKTRLRAAGSLNIFTGKLVIAELVRPGIG
jgi:hypothetical protein